MNKEEQTWAMLCHLAAFSVFLGLPVGNILGPLIIWLVKKDEFSLVDDQGRESLNFQISFTIYSLVLAAAAAVIGLVTCGIGLVVFIPLFVLLAGAEVVLVILASVSAYGGTPYRYPFVINFL